MQGLQNMGSTCAVNSLIQIICREPNLRNALLECDLPDDTLSAHLKEILHLMHNEQKSLVPGKFISKLYEAMKGIFRLGEQLDIGELWTFLFDKIATELSNIPNAYYDLPQLTQSAQSDTEYIDDTGFIYNDDIEYKRALIGCPQLRKKYNHMLCKFNNNKSSKWLDTCQGFFLNITKCSKCHNVLYNFEPFTTISVDMVEGNSVTALTKMLSNFLQEEKRQGDWKCSKCNEHTEYTKTIKIWRLPPVVVFIVKRFANLSAKNTAPIYINNTICFKRGSVLSSTDRDLTYTLSSLGIHFGSLHGGHYCAICNIEEDKEKKLGYDKIMIYDDLNVTHVPKEKYQQLIEHNTDAYMIVYTS